MKKPPKNNIITDPDWAEEIADVKPLKDTPQPTRTLDSYEVDDWDDIPLTVSEDEFSVALEDETKPNVNIQSPAKPPEEFTVAHSTTDKLRGERVSIDPKVRKKLAKGELKFTRKLDLHGYYFDEAFDALANFLQEAQNQGQRCVLVIHGKGKGYGEGGNIGLIKSKITSWLQSNSAVLAYHTAQPKHGGSGSVYVLLRRKR